MLHQLKHGKNLPTLIRLASRSNEPLPEEIANAPQLFLGSDFYFDIFIDLSSDRASDNGAIFSIPFTTILKYCEFYEFSKSTTKLILRFVRALDYAYVNWANEEVAKKAKTKAT